MQSGENEEWSAEAVAAEQRATPKSDEDEV